MTNAGQRHQEAHAGLVARDGDQLLVEGSDFLLNGI
jgi:hypothetical protein